MFVILFKLIKSIVMKYMGSKNRIAKHLLPIMLSECEKHGITKWVEPFVGGANMIDKVPESFERTGCDLNPHTIEALIGIRDHVDEFPNFVSEEFYKSIKKTDAHPINSWIRFECSFGAKLDNGYARNAKGANYAQMGLNLALKQSPKIQNVKLICDSYENLSFENCLIYCDPPYQGTTGYKTEVLITINSLIGADSKLKRTLFLFQSIMHLMTLLKCGKVKLRQTSPVHENQQHTKL